MLKIKERLIDKVITNLIMDHNKKILKTREIKELLINSLSLYKGKSGAAVDDLDIRAEKEKEEQREPTERIRRKCELSEDDFKGSGYTVCLEIVSSEINILI